MKESTVFHPDVQTDFEVQPLKGDASTRSYFRLNFKSDLAIPKTVVLMKTGAPLARDGLDFLKLEEFLDACNVPVPAVYFANHERGYIYLEDCGDELLADRTERADETEVTALYRRTLDILLTIQLEGTRRATHDNPAQTRKFDTEKYLAELDHTLTHFIKGYLGKALSSGDEARLNAVFADLVKPIETEPMVFTHRDYHARNIMLKGERMYVIDFQDARMGPVQYDLASLLFDSYVALPDRIRNGLLGYYLSRLQLAQHAPVDKERFLSMFYRVALQRNLKALGTFGYQATVMNNGFYRQFVPRTVGYVKTNLAMVEEMDRHAAWLTNLLEDA